MEANVELSRVAFSVEAADPAYRHALPRLPGLRAAGGEWVVDPLKLPAELGGGSSCSRQLEFGPVPKVRRIQFGLTGRQASLLGPRVSYVHPRLRIGVLLVP